MDYYVKNPAEAAKDSKCKSSFHCMKCFACGGESSFCVFRSEAGNQALAEMHPVCPASEIPGRIDKLKGNTG